MPPQNFHRPAVLSRRAALTLLAAYPMSASAEMPDVHTFAVFGDSQAEGLAAGLRRVARQFPGTKIQNRTKAGTAISQPDNYDWTAAIQDYDPEPSVTTAVLMFGGNDRLPMHPATGPAIPFRSATWNAIYRTRIDAMLHSLSDKNLAVFWVGQPICRDQKYSQDMEYLNTIFREATTAGAVSFVDIWAAITDGAGQYAAHGRTADGTTARLRLDDGIHFTPSGYDILALKVLQTIQATAEAPK